MVEFRNGTNCWLKIIPHDPGYRYRQHIHQRLGEGLLIMIIQFLGGGGTAKQSGLHETDNGGCDNMCCSCCGQNCVSKFHRIPQLQFENASLETFHHQIFLSRIANINANIGRVVRGECEILAVGRVGYYEQNDCE